MCGYSNSDDEKVQIYFGAWGPYLKVDNKFYCKNTMQDVEEITREEMSKLLYEYTKEELIELLLQFVDNGEEG